MLVVFFLPLLVIPLGELVLGLPLVRLGHVMFDQEIIHAKLLSFRKRIDPAEHSSVFIELSSLDPHHLVQQHFLDDLFHLFPKLPHLPLSGLGGVDPTQPKGESSEFAV